MFPYLVPLASPSLPPSKKNRTAGKNKEHLKCVCVFNIYMYIYPGTYTFIFIC